MSALNGNRQAVVGFPGMTAWLIRNRAEAGDAVLCFDEYVPYFAQWFETYGYGSIDDRAEELARLKAAAAPLLARKGLWVMCSPVGETGLAQGKWLEAQGFWLADLRPKPPKGGGWTEGVILGVHTQEAVDEEQEALFQKVEASVTPSQPKTPGEIIAWLTERYGAQPLAMLPHERDKIRADRLLHQGADAPEDLDAAYERLYAQQDQAPLANVQGFRLTKLKEPQEKWRPKSGSVDVHSYRPEDVAVFFDFDSGGGFSQCSGAGDMFDELHLFQGVTVEDIRTRSPRFQTYAYTMSRLGRV